MSGTTDDSERPMAPRPEPGPGCKKERGQRATVVARLTNGMLRLRTADGKELAGHAALDLRMALTRLLPGDAVEIEVSPFDPTKARILALAKQQQAGRRFEGFHGRTPVLQNAATQRDPVQQPKPTTPK